ncbi:MAG: hypothetical protein ACPG7F_01750 [Aggregatilineales bacterium]
MQMLIDVMDADGNKLGEGPVLTASSVNVTRALDGAGTIAINCPATDERALTLLQTERRVRVHVQDTGGKRIMGEGVLRQRKIRDTPGGAVLTVDGPDILDELKLRNTLMARIYNQQTVAAVASNLIALVPGWSVTVDSGIASNVIDARYDGISILKAFQNLAARYGYHLRLDDAGTRTLTVGAMGADNGLRAQSVAAVSQSLLANDTVMPVQNINFGEDSESICNWILLYGAGEGVAALTLEKSTLSGNPYTIQSMAGPDGTTLYYLSDSASIATYGQKEKVIHFKEVAPLSNSTVDTRNAADALYTAGVEYLTRHKDPQESYSVTVKSVKNNLLTGDKIHLQYKGQVEYVSKDDRWHDYLDIRGDFWIMKVRESISSSGINVTLDLSSIDRRKQTAVEEVLSAIESIKLRNLKPTFSGSKSAYVYQKNIDSTHPVTVPIEITDATTEIQRARLRIKTTPFEAVTSAAASGGSSTQSSTAGGDHNHRVATPADIVGFPTTQNNPYWMRDGDGGALLATVLNSDTRHLAIWTEDSSGDHSHSVNIPSHTHAMSFGNLQTDSATPTGITVSVNGTDKTTELFGSASIAPSGGNQDVSADAGVLTTLLEDAIGGLRQDHQIQIACSSGRGAVEVTVEVFEVIQTIKLA